MPRRRRQAESPTPPPVPTGPPRPWQKPGFTFAIGWPPGFVPQLQRTRELAQSQLARSNREARLAKGDTGTILGLSPKSDADLLLRRVRAARAVQR
jgi:hypothetical protein